MDTQAYFSAAQTQPKDDEAYYDKEKQTSGQTTSGLARSRMVIWTDHTCSPELIRSTPSEYLR